MSGQIKHFYEFGAFRLAPEERLLLHDGVPVPLAPKAFEMLVVLVSHHSHLLTKDELLKSVWADTIVEENSLDKNVSELRKILGGGGPEYIETVRGHGYRFAAEVKEVREEEETEGDQDALESARSGSAYKSQLKLELKTLESSAIEPQPVITLRNADRATWIDELKARKIGAFLGIALLLLIITTSFTWIRSMRGGKHQERPPEMTTERLTNGGDVRNATLSPDGKYFVYEEQDGGVSHLWVRQTGQNNPLEIVPPAERNLTGTTFSPDGQFVYYTTAESKQDNSGTLYRVPTLGGVQTKLLEHVDSPVTFSPDGKQIAFARYGADDSSLVIAASDGSSERVLLERKGRVTIGASGSAWSPDGGMIACSFWNYATPASEALITVVGVDVQSGAVKLLTEQKWDACWRIAWTGDGLGLVLIGTRQGEGDSVQKDQVWHVTYPAGEVRRITTDLSRYLPTSLGVTNDSNAVLVVPFNRTSQIWSMDANGDSRTAQQLTNGTGDGRSGIATLPDNHVVYVARTGVHVDLWQMNADGTQQKQLTNDSPFLEEVRAAPDGRTLFFASKRSGRSHLFSVDGDGANLKQLTSGDSYEIDSDFSPDGKWIVYASKRVFADKIEPESLWKSSLDGGEPIQLTENNANTPYFSPDGRYVSYIAIERGQNKIGIISAEGGATVRMFEPVNIAELNMGSHWTPDGQALTYMVMQKNVGNIWLQPLNGDAPRQLTNFKDGEIYNYAFSRDGTRLFLARGHQIHDALLIKNFR